MCFNLDETTLIQCSFTKNVEYMSCNMRATRSETVELIIVS